jgi:hypothetical protein
MQCWSSSSDSWGQSFRKLRVLPQHVSYWYSFYSIRAGWGDWLPQNVQVVICQTLEGVPAIRPAGFSSGAWLRPLLHVFMPPNSSCHHMYLSLSCQQMHGRPHY